MSGRHAILVACATVLLACTGDDRTTPPVPGSGRPLLPVRQSELQPGAALPTATMQNPFGGNPQAVAEGRRLYHWYNCSGCHFNGGGGIGPPLMDDDWIYGSSPQNILATVLEGRPDGMPSYGGKLPIDHAWKIVAYVESMGGVPEGQQPADAGRNEPAEVVDEEAPIANAEPERGGEAGGQ